jgi:hypothetical protein
MAEFDSKTGTRSMERESVEEAFDWQEMVGSPIDG